MMSDRCLRPRKWVERAGGVYDGAGVSGEEAAGGRGGRVGLLLYGGFVGSCPSLVPLLMMLMMFIVVSVVARELGTGQRQIGVTAGFGNPDRRLLHSVCFQNTEPVFYSM